MLLIFSRCIKFPICIFDNFSYTCRIFIFPKSCTPVPLEFFLNQVFIVLFFYNVSSSFRDIEIAWQKKKKKIKKEWDPVLFSTSRLLTYCSSSSVKLLRRNKKKYGNIKFLLTEGQISNILTTVEDSDSCKMIGNLSSFLCDN